MCARTSFLFSLLSTVWTIKNRWMSNRTIKMCRNFFQVLYRSAHNGPVIKCSFQMCEMWRSQLFFLRFWMWCIQSNRWSQTIHLRRTNKIMIKFVKWKKSGKKRFFPLPESRKNSFFIIASAGRMLCLRLPYSKWNKLLKSELNSSGPNKIKNTKRKESIRS